MARRLTGSSRSRLWLAAGWAAPASATAWVWVAATSGDASGPADLPAAGPDMTRYVPATPPNPSTTAATAAQTGRIPGEPG